MFQLFIKRLVLFICLHAACFNLQAQSAVEMNVEANTTSNRNNLVDIVVTLNNTSTDSFAGTLKITTPDGFKNISDTEIVVALKANERIFVPIKVLKGKQVKAGISEIKVELLSEKQDVLIKKTIKHQVDEFKNITLQAVSPTILLTNSNDSLSVKVKVANLGNTPQQVFVVFSIPELINDNGFFEKTALIDVRKDTIFDLKLWMPTSLIEKTQFTVNVAAMSGSEKTLFGNLSINVQNVSPVKRYEDMLGTRYAQLYQKNSITTSYRTSGKNTNVYQLIGYGEVDVPAGYLSIIGNIYKTDSQKEPMISNTYVAYQLDNHSVKIGNINHSTEMPLFGRGVEMQTASTNKNNKLQIGFIDENFNLTEKNAFLKRGYGIYALGTLSATNPSNNSSFSYVFKEDVAEFAKHHVIGIENEKMLGENWNLRTKAHGALSYYDKNNKNQPSFAFETQYNGTLKNIRLSGNYFLSSNYFPGNRRGVVQIQQNVVKNLSKGRTFFTSVFFSDFSPESYSYQSNIRTTNFRLDTGITFPRLKSIGATLGYQHYMESGNGFGWLVSNGSLGIQAYRFTENFNWLSKNQKHSIIFGIEEGFAKMADTAKLKPQFKLQTLYSFKGLNASATYQYGSFFLSEYASVLAAGNQKEDFKRIMLSVSADRKFLDDKLFVRSGAAYINDFMTGKTPSAFLNMQYLATEKYRVYLNSSWYHYGQQRFFQTTGIILEAGITINFGGKAASAGKKGTLSAQLFFDKNGNNLYDADDEMAPDFFVTIDKTTFKTDAQGSIQYSHLPFGIYKQQPILQNGWFADAAELVFDSFSKKILVPLHQNGSFKGKINYNYEQKTVKDFDFKTAGIVFTITKNGKFVQRISSDDDGVFVAFLPTGTYEITINSDSLADNTFCEKDKQEFTVNAGVLTHLPNFIINVKQKQVRVKKFGS